MGLNVVCAIIALVIAVLGTLGTSVRTYQTVSKYSIRNRKKKFFSVVIRTIGLFSAVLATLSLTFPVVFGGAEFMKNETVRLIVHIARAVNYGSITCQCILQSYFVYQFPLEDATPKVVKLRHLMFIIGSMIIGALVAGSLFLTTELCEINDYSVLEAEDKTVFVPLIMHTAAILLFLIFTIRFYVKAVKNMMAIGWMKFLFHIILVGLLLISTVVIVLLDTWTIPFREEVEYQGQLVRTILPIPATFFAFIHFMNNILTTRRYKNCRKLFPCLIPYRVAPATVRQEVYSVN